MTVHLPPAKVVSHIFEGGIENNTPIEGRWILQRSGGKERRPVENVTRREVRDGHRH